MPADLQHAARLLDASSSPRLAISSMVGSRPSSCISFLRDVAQLAHRLDHVHRDADRAGMIGDGAGDRLANPPRRVGAELVAAAIFVLVDRPHQAGVAFLDDVQEATGRGCGTSWRSRRPDAGCRRTVCAWRLRTCCRSCGSARRACAGSRRLPARDLPGRRSSSWQTSRSSPGSLTFFSSSIRCSSSTILVLMRRELLHQRRDLAGAQRKLFEQLHRSGGGGGGCASCSSSSILLVLGCAERIPVVAVALEHLRGPMSRFSGMRWPIVPLSA